MFFFAPLLPQARCLYRLVRTRYGIRSVGREARMPKSIAHSFVRDVVRKAVQVFEHVAQRNLFQRSPPPCN